ncbi:MAG: GDP-mannose 4,6-dehydratase [Nocardiaceae bacterium]|nr:GDP-mannose 4,6-dehydratase [Nocardiaceae bacterium]
MSAEPTALITGVAGQDGIYLARHLLARGYRVIGVTHVAVPASVYLRGVELQVCDIRDSQSFEVLLRRERPDEIYNLAALSSVGQSWTAAESVAEINAMAVLRILDLLVRLERAIGYSPKFFQASTSEIFGIAEQQPQDEDTPQSPRSPYGSSKAFAHNLTANYRDSLGLFACNGILFNHESPIRPTHFVTRKITRAVAEISLGLSERVVLGNLDARRDWGHAADYVKAMAAILQHDAPDDFVIASGRSASIREFMELAFDAVGIAESARYVDFDPAFLRPAEIPQTWGNPKKAETKLGWTPSSTLRDLVTHMVRADTVRIRTGIEECLGYLFAETVDDALAFTSESHAQSCPHCCA